MSRFDTNKFSPFHKFAGKANATVTNADCMGQMTANSELEETEGEY